MLEVRNVLEWRISSDVNARFNQQVAYELCVELYTTDIIKSEKDSLRASNPSRLQRIGSWSAEELQRGVKITENQFLEIRLIYGTQYRP